MSIPRRKKGEKKRRDPKAKKKKAGSVEKLFSNNNGMLNARHDVAHQERACEGVKVGIEKQHAETTRQTSVGYRKKKQKERDIIAR